MQCQISHILSIHTSKAVRRLKLNFSVRFENLCLVKTTKTKLNHSQVPLDWLRKTHMMKRITKTPPSPLLSSWRKTFYVCPFESVEERWREIFSKLKWRRSQWHQTSCIDCSVDFSKHFSLWRLTNLLKTSTERDPHSAARLWHVGHNRPGLASSTHQSNMKAIGCMWRGDVL